MKMLKYLLPLLLLSVTASQAFSLGSLFSSEEAAKEEFADEVEDIEEDEEEEEEEDMEEESLEEEEEEDEDEEDEGTYHISRILESKMKYFPFSITLFLQRKRMKKKNLRLLKTKRTWTTSLTRRKKMKVRGNKNKTKKCGIFHNWVDFILFLASGPLMGGFLKKNIFPLCDDL